MSSPFSSKGIERSGDYAGYAPLLAQIAHFFVTHDTPVPIAETIEIYAFMAAADTSRAADGRRVTLEDELARARAELAATSARQTARISRNAADAPHPASAARAIESRP